MRDAHAASPTHGPLAVYYLLSPIGDFNNLCGTARSHLLSPVCDFVGASAWTTRYALRVSRSVIVSLNLKARSAI